MKLIKYTIVSSILLLSCNSKKIDCKQNNFKSLKLWPVNTDLLLPEYKLVDTIKYGTETLLTYNIKSVGSLININAFVISHENDNPAGLDINHIMVVQKQEIESGQNSKKLLMETFKNVDNIKIGYLKYIVEQANKKFYAGRIFFYKDKKLVILWLFEKYDENEDEEHLTMDCILQSIKFY